MTIAEARDKCKGYLARIPRDVLIIAILLAACIASFGLGYLAGRDKGQGSDASLTASPSPIANAPGQVVASKSGTKYYLPGCTGVEKISEDNKVWFATPALARAQGYEPAAHCDGL